MRGFLALLIAVWPLLHPHADSASPQLAYVGPGAGFVFVGSFLSVLFGFLAAFFSFLIWPFRMAWRFITRRHSLRGAHVRKIIFLGMDGLDPKLVEKFMEQGKLPNFSRLRAEGSYRRLRTTFPALSPVAWSTFATGVNPAKHNMFDFLNRNLVSYLPELASSKVYPPKRVWKIGRYRIPLSRPMIEMRRKSQPFWKILGQHFIPSTIIRVPLTFPPEKFNGRLLSAMCTPDLLGSRERSSFSPLGPERPCTSQAPARCCARPGLIFTVNWKAPRIISSKAVHLSGSPFGSHIATLTGRHWKWMAPATR